MFLFEKGNNNNIYCIKEVNDIKWGNKDFINIMVE